MLRALARARMSFSFLMNRYVDGSTRFSGGDRLVLTSTFHQGSIDPADFDEMIDYVTSNLIPNALGPNSDLRVGAIGYSENVDKIYDLNDAPTDGNRGPLISAIRSNAKESLTTDTYAALDEAIKMFKSAKNPVKASNRYVILFTDGVPDTDNLCQGGTPNSQLGITDETILTVAIGTFSRDALECFFGNNDKNLFEVQDFDLLDDKLTKAIENEVCLPPETPELGLWDKIKQTCNCGKFKKGDTCPKDAIYARFPKANVRFVRRMMRRYRRYCRPYGL